MTIQAIGTAGAALYLSPEDLRAEGLSYGELPPERALEIIRFACRRAGITLEGPLEIDAFPSGKGVLLFARTCRPRRHLLHLTVLRICWREGRRWPSRRRRPLFSGGRSGGGSRFRRRRPAAPLFSPSSGSPVIWERDWRRGCKNTVHRSFHRWRLPVWRTIFPSPRETPRAAFFRLTSLLTAML